MIVVSPVNVAEISYHLDVMYKNQRVNICNLNVWIIKYNLQKTTVHEINFIEIKYISLKTTEVSSPF